MNISGSTECLAELKVNRFKKSEWWKYFENVAEELKSRNIRVRLLNLCDSFYIFVLLWIYFDSIVWKHGLGLLTSTLIIFFGILTEYCGAGKIIWKINRVDDSEKLVLNLNRSFSLKIGWKSEFFMVTKTRPPNNRQWQ